MNSERGRERERRKEEKRKRKEESQAMPSNYHITFNSRKEHISYKLILFVVITVVSIVFYRSDIQVVFK